MLYYYFYDLHSGEISHSLPLRSTIPKVPDAFPDTSFSYYYLPSPRQNIVLYARCPSQNYTNEFIPRCDDSYYWAIYNLDTQQTLATPNYPDSGRRFFSLNYYAAWSSSGRFLAYHTEDVRSKSELIIYDLDNDTYLDTTSVQVSGDIGIQVFNIEGYLWSPDETQIAMWYISFQLDTTSGAQALLGVYDLPSDTFTLSDDVYFRSTSGSAWMPDSKSVAVGLNDGRILLVSPDGTEKLLDTSSKIIGATY